MKYEFTKEQLTKIRKILKDIEYKISLWEKEKESAIRDRAKAPNKYYTNITSRVKHAENQIKLLENKKEELTKALEDKGLEI